MFTRNHPHPFQAMDEQGDAELKRHAEFRKRTTADAWAAVLSSEPGRLVLWEILHDRCGAFHASFDMHNPIHTAYLEGKRSVAREILDDFELQHPDVYVQMLHDYLERRRIDELVRQRAESRIGDE